ncbi:MAG TPA: SDR family oxidoreductase [Steroidobacteraceae bacterium]|nr:SDR family oxidoreductase [Steroidobacteraceae bacterium]
MQTEFIGKSAIVTGSSEGIGFALAKGLVDAGARVLLVARREDVVRKAAEGLGPNAAWIAVDLTEEGAEEKVVRAAIDRHGGIDYLVNNAGLNLPAFIGDYRASDFRRMVDLNMVSTTMLTQAAVPYLAAGDGSAILNISTGGSRKATIGNGLYSATKIAINYLTEVWALELADRGIRVNCICPGGTETPQFCKVADSIEGYREMVIGVTPVKRMCAPEELVHSAFLLLSKRTGGFITGAILDADGGYHI